MRKYQCLTVLFAVSTSFTLSAQGQGRVIERPVPPERTRELQHSRESRPGSEAERARQVFGWSPTPERPVRPLPVPKPTPPVLHFASYVRSERDRIREAQTKLAERGYLDPTIDVDGKIGPLPHLSPVHPQFPGHRPDRSGPMFVLLPDLLV